MKSCAMTAVSWPISVWACSFDSREKPATCPFTNFKDVRPVLKVVCMAEISLPLPAYVGIF